VELRGAGRQALVEAATVARVGALAAGAGVVEGAGGGADAGQVAGRRVLARAARTVFGPAEVVDLHLDDHDLLALEVVQGDVELVLERRPAELLELLGEELPVQRQRGSAFGDAEILLER